MDEPKKSHKSDTYSLGEKADYWYYKSVAAPLFNQDARFLTTRKKPVTYALFGQLFLAPMMLPHHNASEKRNILCRQLTFLEEYSKVLLNTDCVSGDHPGQRAINLLNALKEGASQLDREQSKNWDKQAYAVRSSSYASPERYLSFYRFLEQDKESKAEKYIQDVEELYHRELMLIFELDKSKDMEMLGKSLRAILDRLPEKGTFAVRGGKDATLEALCNKAGRILSCALLWAAAERVNDWEVYNFLHQRVNMPMPISTTNSGRSILASASIPFSSISELCASICEESELLKPRTARAILKTLERFPSNLRVNSLRTLLSAVSHARKFAYSKANQEQGRSLRQKWCALAVQLDQLEGEIEALQQVQQDPPM